VCECDEGMECVLACSLVHHSNHGCRTRGGTESCLLTHSCDLAHIRLSSDRVMCRSCPHLASPVRRLEVSVLNVHERMRIPSPRQTIIDRYVRILVEARACSETHRLVHTASTHEQNCHIATGVRVRIMSSALHMDCL
jgi:hypothetical protein